MTQVRVIVVTTEKPVATKRAAWKAASAMPITGPSSLARGIEAGVAEAGDDDRVETFAGGQPHLFGNAGGAEGLVELALDRHRPEARLAPDDLRAGRGDWRAAAAMPRSSRQRCWG